MNGKSTGNAEDTISRRRFLGITAFATSALMAHIDGEAAEGKSYDRRMGTWARLATADPNWNAHHRNDPKLASFIKNESRLVFDTDIHVVTADNLEELCRHRFIFSNSLNSVNSSSDLGNIREYLYRGGFLYVDACLSHDVTPDVPKFIQEHMNLLASILPGTTPVPVPADHPIFKFCFNIKESDLTSFYKTPWKQSMYAYYDDNRIMVILSLESLQCGWPQDKKKELLNIKQILNLYTFAMAQ